MEYIKPELEIIVFEENHDVVTLSRDPAGGNEGGGWGDFTQ